VVIVLMVVLVIHALAHPFSLRDTGVDTRCRQA